MKKLFTILLLFSSFSLFAQGEYNNWCFGQNTWMDFNSGAPVLKVSSIQGTGSSSTISDKNGNLLFYADYLNIYNSNHSIMVNGSGVSNIDLIQSISILPFPCTDSLYYLFFFFDSVRSGQLVRDLKYHIINMNKNNGLGEVIQKNILLDTNITLGLGMTRHSNNRDYWITYQKDDTNIFYSRQITSVGIGSKITSQLGLNKTWHGALKFSSDSKHLVSCTFVEQKIYHYDFNNSTGILSNAFELNLPSSLPFPVTTSSQFSPDLSKLYVTTLSDLIQYDFSSNNPSIIANSSVILTPINNTIGYIDIALAPNNIIYISTGPFLNLATISQPNNLGLACNLNNNGFNTGNLTGAGFPTMLPNLFVHREVLTDSLFCQYDTVNLYLSDTNFIDSVTWNFGDTASGVLNTSTDVIPLHVFNQYGEYPIEVIIYSGCSTDTINDTIRINPTPIANLGNDTILCEGDSMQLLFNDTSFSYAWSAMSSGFIDSAMLIQILQADTYTVAISSICGTDYDTIVIDSLIAALVHLPNDTLLCDGDSLFLDATIQSGTYLWSTSDTTPTIWATTQDTFYVSTLNFCGADSDTVVVNFTHAPLFELGADTSLCVGDTLVLNAYDTLSSYLWMNGDTTNFDTITTNGIFSVTTTNLCGSYSDTLQAWFLSPPVANLGNDTILCLGDTIGLSDTTLFGSYVWSDASVNDTLWVSSSGNYVVTVTNLCGADSDTVLVETDTIPVVNLGADTVICNGNSVLLSALSSRSSYLWNTGSTDSVISVNTENTYWATATNLCGAGSDTIFVDVDSVLTVELGTDTILCLGMSYWLKSNVNGDSYVWNNGSILDSIFIQSANNYSLAVTNVCGSFNDSIEVHYDNSPITNLGPDSTYCLSSLVNLNAHWSRANYLWSTADTTANITANFSGNYSVMVTNLCGFDDDTVNIQYDIPILFNLGPDTVLCVGDSIYLAAPAHNANWLWNNGSQDSILVVDTAGQYYVTANNHCGVFRDSINVVSQTLPVVNPPINDTTFCEGLSYDITINPNNANAILWLDGSTDFNQEIDSAGWYSYALKNICGATKDTFHLEIQYPANASLGNDTVLCYGEPLVKAFPYPNHTFLWNTGETDSVKTITEQGYYGVTIWTPANCESYGEFDVTNCDAQIFVPNAFTPGNFDNLNNTFKIEGLQLKKFHIVIYDRWGGLVFESRDINISWDGSINGSPAAPGIYSYKIWYNTGLSSGSENQSIVKVGVVNLIR